MEVVVGSLDKLPRNGMAEYSIDGLCVLVCRTGDSLYATGGVCPHRGAQLSQGTIQDSVVVCPWHEWAFDVETGCGITNPVSGLVTYPVTVRGGLIVITVPDN